jgi:hypothetical protein
MLEVHERPARLLIIGGGHIGKALAVIGNLCGFSVEVVDDRVEYANQERFPEADRVTAGRFDEVLQGYPIDGNTYIVCVTRGHRQDETSLGLVVDSPAAYVGMIGSKRRVAAVLQHLVGTGQAGRGACAHRSAWTSGQNARGDSGRSAEIILERRARRASISRLGRCGTVSRQAADGGAARGDAIECGRAMRLAG